MARRTERCGWLAMVMALALAAMACEENAAPSASGPIDLMSLVVTVDAVADVVVEEIDRDDETATIRVHSVEWHSPSVDSVPPRRARMWWLYQDLQAVQPGDRVLVLLTYAPETSDVYGGSWRASLVLDGDTLAPFPASGGDSPHVTADEELRDLYGSASSRMQKLKRLVAYVDGDVPPPLPRTRTLEQALASPTPPDPLTAWRSLPRHLRSLDSRDRPAGHGLTFQHVRVVITPDPTLAQNDRYAGVGILNDSGVIRVQAMQPGLSHIPLDLSIVVDEPIEVVLYNSAADAVARRLGTIPFGEIAVPYATQIDVSEARIAVSPLSQPQYTDLLRGFSQSAGG